MNCLDGMTDEAIPKRVLQYKLQRHRDAEKVGDDVMNMYGLNWLDCLYREGKKSKKRKSSFVH
jgi:hypothetical protein